MVSTNRSKPSLSTAFRFAARITLGVLFIYASIDKLLYQQAFAEAVYNYQILPDALINLTAIVLPWLEWLVGICLLLNVWTSGAVLLSSGMLLVFIGAVVFNLARGLDISCGCFSARSGDAMSFFTVVRDAVFLSIAVLLTIMTFAIPGASRSDV